LSAHPIIGNGPHQLAPQRAKLAMAIRGHNAHYRMHEVQRRHWTAQALRADLGAAFAATLIEELVREMPRVVDSVRAQLPDEFPADLADSILQGLLNQARRLSALPPA
jgi:serine/threonine-protein kinase HipA